MKPPVPSHRWEEQFKGTVGPPPVDALRERIRELREAFETLTEAKPQQRRAWEREILWRNQQIINQTEDKDVHSENPK